MILLSVLLQNHSTGKQKLSYLRHNRVRANLATIPNALSVSSAFFYLSGKSGRMLALALLLVFFIIVFLLVKNTSKGGE